MPACVELGAFDWQALIAVWTQTPTVASQAEGAPVHVRAWTAAPLALSELDEAIRCAPLAHRDTLAALRAQCARTAWGLLPGLHRLRWTRPQAAPLYLNLHVGADAAWHAQHAREADQHAPAPLNPHACRVGVVGAGLAGAACAHALAQRGFDVHVFDQAAHPAAGASGLPVGLVAPHTSPDDNVLSRLSRAGVRAMRDALMHAGLDADAWADLGVQERRLPGKTRKGGAPAQWATDWPLEARDWTAPDDRLGAPDHALWHPHGAWVRPAALVRALLDHPRIVWHGGVAVPALRRAGDAWQALQASEPGWVADQWVLAVGPQLPALLQASGLDAHALPMRPLRGQLSWGLMPDVTPPLGWPRTPVNGHGSFVHSIATPEGPAWFAGSTYDRTRDTATLLETDHHANLERVQALLPEHAAALADAFAQGRVRGWAGVRCSVPDRLPMVGALADTDPGLWVCGAMGSRGLTLAVLCAEVLAAQWCGEPQPIEPALRRALSATRFAASRGAAA